MALSQAFGGCLDGCAVNEKEGGAKPTPQRHFLL